MKSEAELHALAPERLDALAGPMDWREAAMTLQQALEQRVISEHAWVLIGPPAAGYGDLLTCWARQQGAICIPDPGYEHLTGDDRRWFEAWPKPLDQASPEQAQPWTLPRLERCWLRHPAGLGLVRALFERLLAGRLGFGLIGCDSWTWAYLRFVVPTSRVRVLTFQAFDGERLAGWLAELAAADDGRPCRFRHAQSGNLLLRVNDDEPQERAGVELRYLAAQSCGTAAVALRLWRARLRSEPEASDATEKVDLAKDADPAATTDPVTHTTERDGAEVIWVAPAVDPSLPSGLGEPDALLLHALLLHDGLPSAILEALLPLPRLQIRARLQQLAAADVVACDETRWRVTVFAYPAVRAFLADRDFLTDAL